MSTPILWHKLDSAGNSELGPNPSFYRSPTFVDPIKFGEAMRTTTGGGYADFGIVTTGVAFAFDFYWKPKASTVGYYWLLCENYDLQMYVGPGQNLYLSIGYAPTCYYVFFHLPFANDDLIWFQVSCDPSLDAQQRIKVWQKVNDGTLSQLPMAGFYYDAPWTETTKRVMLSSDRGDGYYSDVIIDNFKFYNIPNPDFSWDMNNEGIYVPTRKKLHGPIIN